VGGAAERSGGAIRTQFVIRGEDVQLFPRGLHNGRPSGWHGVVSTLTTMRLRGLHPGCMDQTRGGDFLVAISGDFDMATDSCRSAVAGLPERGLVGPGVQ